LGFDSGRVHKILHNPTNQPKGAMWKPMTMPHGTFPLVEYDTTCQALDGPRIYHVPCHLSPSHHCTCSVSLLTSSHATCHPYSGDTCHAQTGPPHLAYTLSPAMCLLQEMPHQLYGRTACTVILPRGTVRTIQSPTFFPCLGF
jgi:hypothetical protein